MELVDLTAKRQIGDDLSGDRTDLSERFDAEPVPGEDRHLCRIEAGRDFLS